MYWRVEAVLTLPEQMKQGARARPIKKECDALVFDFSESLASQDKEAAPLVFENANVGYEILAVALNAQWQVVNMAVLNKNDPTKIALGAATVVVEVRNSEAAEAIRIGQQVSLCTIGGTNYVRFSLPTHKLMRHRHQRQPPEPPE